MGQALKTGAIYGGRKSWFITCSLPTKPGLRLLIFPKWIHLNRIPTSWFRLAFNVNGRFSIFWKINVKKGYSIVWQFDSSNSWCCCLFPGHTPTPQLNKSQTPLLLFLEQKTTHLATIHPNRVVLTTSWKLFFLQFFMNNLNLCPHNFFSFLRNPFRSTANACKSNKVKPSFYKTHFITTRLLHP